MTRARTVLLVHDVVNDFVDPSDAGQRTVLENVAALVAAARTAAVPVVFVAPGRGDPAIAETPPQPGREILVWGTPGVDVAADLGPLAGDTVIRKPRWGGFYGSALARHLRDLECETLIVCGFSLGGGITTTVRDAFNHDLQSVVVADACLCRAIPDQGWGAVSSEQAAKVVLSILAQRFARVMSTAKMCRVLASFAGYLRAGLVDETVVEKG